MRLYDHKNHSIDSLPTITSQPFIHQDLQMLAVIFDMTNTAETGFDPHFLQNDKLKILTLQQDFLWEKSCYELFVTFDNAKNSPYVEVNFSPDGEFNLYHFDSYRMPLEMPPRWLNLSDSQRQKLINFYHVNGETSAVFWQDSLPPHRALRDLIQKEFPLEIDKQRLLMMININLLANLLKVQKTDKIWLNPCAVYQGKESRELTYFAYQHASPPDFHDKKYWVEVVI